MLRFMGMQRVGHDRATEVNCCSTLGKHPKQEDQIIKVSGATIIRQEEDPVCPPQGRQATQTTRAQSQNQPVFREGF